MTEVWNYLEWEQVSFKMAKLSKHTRKLFAYYCKFAKQDRAVRVKEINYGLISSSLRQPIKSFDTLVYNLYGGEGSF